MKVYTVYADVKEGIDARTFVANMKLFLDKLPQMHDYRITRMKLGFRSMDLPEFRIDMEFESMQALDDAMSHVVANVDDIETEHSTREKSDRIDALHCVWFESLKK